MNIEKLDNPLDEQLESSSTEADLVSDGDDFEMNLAEKSDIDLFSEPIDTTGQEPSKNAPKDLSTPNEPLAEHEPSTSTDKDLHLVGDYFEMNLAEKSDVNPYDVEIVPERRVKDSSRNDDWQDKDS